MKRLILVNQVAGPMFIDIANYFVQLGYEVQLLTGQMGKTGNSIHPAVQVFKRTKYKRNNPFSRIITWSWFTIQTWYFLKNEKKDAEVMLVSNPPFVPLLSHFLHRKKNLTFRILIYDIYPDVLEQSGYLSKHLFLSRWWRKVNEKAFCRSERLYTISHGMQSVLAQYAPAQRWEVIYPWVDTSFIKRIPKSENPFIKKYKLEDKTVILYSGNMGKTHDLITILKVAKELNKHKGYFFLFIGDGAEKRRLMAFAKKYKLTNTLFLPFQQPEVLPFSLSSADIAIVTLTNSAAQLSVPSKTFYQMAAGNPILCIANSDSELARMVFSSNCGIVFAPGSINKIANFLLNLDEKLIYEWANNSLINSNRFTVENIHKFEWNISKV